MTVPRLAPSRPAVPRARRVVALKRRTPALWPRVLLWVVGLAVVLGVAALVLFGSPASERAARRIADRELQMTLEPGERIEGSAHVVQRHALDYFRETHGTLAATDRRVIFIGVLPRDFLEPERDLPAFDVRVYPYDTVLTLRGARVFFDRASGVRVRSEAGREAFSVSRGEWPRVQDVIRAANRHVLVVRQSVEREREAIAEAAARPPVRVFHGVKRGESLIAIARLYSTTPESLLVLNAKRDSSLKAGDTLLVRIYRDTTVYYRDTLLPGRRQ
ncbi:MAG: LysM peptidoglycan-binding domain-containing protein [Gemmatimonadaceae bacterium]